MRKTTKFEWVLTALAIALSAVVVACSSGCGSDAVVDPHGPYQAEADAATALVMSAVPDIMEDGKADGDGEGPKVGDVCPICDGTGTVGDGRIAKRCRDCGGDGRIDERDVKSPAGAAAAEEPPTEQPTKEPKPSPPVVTPKSVVLHFNNHNYSQWPTQWWQEESRKLAAVGYTVSFERHEDYEKTEPYFIVERDGETFRLTGKHSALEIVTYEKDKK